MANNSIIVTIIVNTLYTISRCQCNKCGNVFLICWCKVSAELTLHCISELNLPRRHFVHSYINVYIDINFI